MSIQLADMRQPVLGFYLSGSDLVKTYKFYFNCKKTVLKHDLELYFD